MIDWMQRTHLLMGEEKMERLKKAHVLIVGVGGVGAYAAEMICRAGIGKLTLIDADDIEASNINRQLPAMHSSIGQSKVAILAQRFKDINPELELQTLQTFMTPDNVMDLLAANNFSFIVDAIDTIQPKCALIKEALHRNIPIVCSMGAGAKKDITQIQFADIWKTYHCGLSKAVRNQMKRMGLRGKKLPVVFSSEAADPKSILLVENERNKKSTTGTISYMPAVFGCYLAEHVIRNI
jgi:tRNA A37 threonylcarbamoyladenosine dehydratase